MQPDPSTPRFRAAQTSFARTPVPAGTPAGTDAAAGGAGEAAATPPEMFRVDDPSQAPAGATAFVTGAYLPSGDVFIDRMLQLERALKQFGPAF